MEYLKAIIRGLRIFLWFIILPFYLICSLWYNGVYKLKHWWTNDVEEKILRRIGLMFMWTVFTIGYSMPFTIFTIAALRNNQIVNAPGWILGIVLSVIGGIVAAVGGTTLLDDYNFRRMIDIEVIPNFLRQN